MTFVFLKLEFTACSFWTLLAYELLLLASRCFVCHRNVVYNMPQFYRWKGYFMLPMKIHWGWIKAHCWKCWWKLPSEKVWQQAEQGNGAPPNHPTAQNNESYRAKHNTTGVKEWTETGLRAKCRKYVLTYSHRSLLINVINFVASSTKPDVYRHYSTPHLVMGTVVHLHPNIILCE